MMKLIPLALFAVFTVIYGAPKLTNDHVTCWTCPHGFAKNETCLDDPADEGRANTCRLGFQDACLTLIIDDPAASWHYHRGCAHKGVTHRLGCHDTTITIEGEGDYAGRECYCIEDLCNNQV